MKRKAEDVLAEVRDAGAADDNNGAEDWSHSDLVIDEAQKALCEDVLDMMDDIDPFHTTDWYMKLHKKLAEYFGQEEL